MNRRLAAALAGMLGILLLPMVPAKACSCASGDAREMLADADAAFIGDHVGSRPGEPPSGSSDDDTIYTFDVAEEFKVDLPDPLDVHSAASGVSCGLEATPGKTYAYFLYLDDNDAWRSSLCLQVDPDELRKAAAPLPDPNGTNPIRFIAGGGYGEGRTVALDKRGRTLAYGYGKQDAGWIAACPGGQRSVEITYNFRDKVRLHVRRLNKFQEVRRLTLPFDANSSSRRPAVWEVLCRDKWARSVLVFGTTYNKHSRSRLIDVTPEGIETLHRGSAFGAHLTESNAYLKTGTNGRKLVRLTLSSGERHEIADLGPYLTAVAVDDDERFITAVKDSYGDGASAKLYLIGIESGETLAARHIGRRQRGNSGETICLTEHRFLILPRGSDNSYGDIYNRRLERVGRFVWHGYGGVVWNGAAYGIDFGGRLLRANLPNGPMETQRKLVSDGLRWLTVVPGDTKVRFDMPAS